MQFVTVSSRYLFLGIALSLPFVVANFIAVTGLEPVYSWLVELGPYGVFTLITLGFLGGVVALLPLCTKGQTGYQVFVLNAVIGVTLIVFFIFVGFALGEEIYRCDILRIPNCD